MAAPGKKAAGGGGTATAGHPTTRGGSWALSQLGEGPGGGGQGQARGGGPDSHHGHSGQGGATTRTANQRG